MHTVCTLKFGTCTLYLGACTLCSDIQNPTFSAKFHRLPPNNSQFTWLYYTLPHPSWIGNLKLSFQWSGIWLEFFWRVCIVCIVCTFCALTCPPMNMVWQYFHPALSIHLQVSCWYCDMSYSMPSESMLVASPWISMESNLEGATPPLQK